MKKTTKIWLLIAASLVVVGCIMFGGSMSKLNWDFSRLSTVKYETNIHSISESFNNLSIITDTADIQVLASDNNQCQVICYEEAKIKHTISIANNTLSIQINDQRKWYEHIGINLAHSKITIYLPSDVYGDLTVNASTGDIEIPKDFSFNNVTIHLSTGHVTNYASIANTLYIKTSTGDIITENISAGNIELSVTTGNIKTKSITCNGEFKLFVKTGEISMINTTCSSLYSKGTTGDFNLKNVIATNNISIERSTGEIEFEKCDAAELILKTTTGDVSGSFLSEKVFIIDTSTGDVVVPNSTNGGKCEIQTTTGDIEIDIAK